MQDTKVKPIPEGYHTLTPFVMVKDADKLIEFIKNAFGGKEISVHKTPDGTIMHAELQVGDSRMMLGEATEKYPAMSGMLYLYAEDCDALYKKALECGATSLREPTNEFYGDRSCGVMDAAGNQWWIATHIEDVSPEEMSQREEELRKQQPGA
ncbi:MAG: VOC family protein [Chitinophagales bacterium]|nr:VOC family protein [Chitinophagales bacterium]